MLGFRISCSKFEYLACNFDPESRRRGNPIEIDIWDVLVCEAFHYLASII